MGTFTQLNTILVLLHTYAFTIGVTAATLMVTVYAIVLMFDNDQSPAARTERWNKLKRVFLAAFLIAGAGAITSTATGLGGMLGMLPAPVV